jgi:hypothetical protein
MAPGSSGSALNVSAATVIKAAPGTVGTVSVVTAGSSVGGVYDLAVTTGYDAANQVGTIPEAVGTYPFFSFPCFAGILIVPGTGQVVSVSFS